MQVNVVLTLGVFDAKIRWPGDTSRSICDVENKGDDTLQPLGRGHNFSSSFFLFVFLLMIYLLPLWELELEMFQDL